MLEEVREIPEGVEAALIILESKRGTLESAVFVDEGRIAEDEKVKRKTLGSISGNESGTEMKSGDRSGKHHF